MTYQNNIGYDVEKLTIDIKNMTNEEIYSHISNNDYSARGCIVAETQDGDILMYFSAALMFVINDAVIDYWYDVVGHLYTKISGTTFDNKLVDVYMYYGTIEKVLVDGADFTTMCYKKDIVVNENTDGTFSVVGWDNVSYTENEMSFIVNTMNDLTDDEISNDDNFEYGDGVGRFTAYTTGMCGCGQKIYFVDNSKKFRSTYSLFILNANDRSSGLYTYYDIRRGCHVIWMYDDHTNELTYVCDFDDIFEIYINKIINGEV